MSAPIDELVGLLDKANRPALLRLQQQYAASDEASRILKLGITAGEPSAPHEDPDLNAARVDVTFEGLELIASGCETILHDLRIWLRWAATIALAGELAALVGGASVLVVLSADLPKFSAYAGGALTLAGSVCGLLGKFVGRDRYGNGSLSDQFMSLVQSRAHADQILVQLKLWKRVGGALDEQIISRANQLAHDLRVLILTYGTVKPRGGT